MDRPGRPYHQLLQAACAAAGFSPAVEHVAAEWDTGAALVAAGLGIALIPRLAHLPAGYPVVRVPLRGDPGALAAHPHRHPPGERTAAAGRAGARDTCDDRSRRVTTFASVASAERAQPAIPSPMTKPPTRIMIVAPSAVE